MSNTHAPLQGGCLCGTVRYEAAPDHRDGCYCHCRMCQLAFGNTRAAFFNLRKAQVRWLTRAPAYCASSKIARRGFIESRLAGWHVEDGLREARTDENAAIQKRWREAYGADVQPGLAALRTIV